MSRRREHGTRRPERSSAAAPYRHPVPPAGDVIDALQASPAPMTLDELSAALGVTGERPLALLRKRLQGLAAAGRVLINRRGEYLLLERLDAVAGTVSAHRDGYGFLVPDDGSEDIFLPAQEMRPLLDGDRIAVRVGGAGRGGRRAGAVVEILARGRDSVVGRYYREHGVGWVVESGRVPHHFLVSDRYRHGAQPGEVVRLEIIEYPDAVREAQGRIVRVLGDAADPRVITRSAIESFALPHEWSAQVERVAGSLGTEVRPSDRTGRVDLRDLPLVTIDGEDARDFDDAVFAEPVGTGWRLVVAIADVSHYVHAGDPIDTEARRRGTSVYFPDRVIPMLPEALSNELCSLRPKVDRLCVACDMQVDAHGRVTGAKFYRAVMHSRARLTYTEVDAAENHTDRAAVARLAAVAPALRSLYAVWRALAGARRRRGALDLDLPETRIELDDEGAIRGIRPRLRNDAHRLIEECMISANVEAARYLRRHRIPTLYRVHSGPEGEKLENLRLLFQGLGIPVAETAGARARELNRVLDAIRGRPDFPILATAVLRSMTQAVYQPANTGHFGLGLQCYAHFTSPIRRYPDLLVHRAIGHLLDGGKPAAFGYDTAAMDLLGRSTSMQERRADEATRYVEARVKCIFMQGRVGETMDGVITSVTHFGLFVTLRDVFVDGLVHVTSLPGDYYHLERGGLSLVGERTGHRFTLGEDVRARIVRVAPDEARIDLALEITGAAMAGARRPSGRAAASRGRSRR